MRSIDQANSRPGLAGSPPAVSQAIDGIARLTRTCTSHEVSSEVTRKCDAGVPSLPSIGSICGSVNPAPARSARTAHSATWAGPTLAPHQPRAWLLTSWEETVPAPMRSTSSISANAHMRPSGNERNVGEKRWPPVWLTRRTTNSGRVASISSASATPLVPQQLSWLPWVQTKKVGDTVGHAALASGRAPSDPIGQPAIAVIALVRSSVSASCHRCTSVVAPERS